MQEKESAKIKSHGMGLVFKIWVLCYSERYQLNILNAQGFTFLGFLQPGSTQISPDTIVQTGEKQTLPKQERRAQFTKCSQNHSENSWHWVKGMTRLKEEGQKVRKMRLKQPKLSLVLSAANRQIRGMKRRLTECQRQGFTKPPLWVGAWSLPVGVSW